MPQFYFHLDDQRGRLVDREGVDLDNLAAATRQALYVVRDLLAEDVRSGQVDLAARIEVTAAGGVPLHILSFADALDASRHDRGRSSSRE